MKEAKVKTYTVDLEDRGKFYKVKEVWDTVGILYFTSADGAKARASAPWLVVEEKNDIEL